jgi:hypothetical protein
MEFWVLQAPTEVVGPGRSIRHPPHGSGPRLAGSLASRASRPRAACRARRAAAPPTGNRRPPLRRARPDTPPRRRLPPLRLPARQVSSNSARSTANPGQGLAGESTPGYFFPPPWPKLLELGARPGYRLTRAYKWRPTVPRLTLNHHKPSLPPLDTGTPPPQAHPSSPPPPGIPPPRATTT